MNQLVSFEVAEYLYNKGIIIDSNYCYCRSLIGIKTVKTIDNNVIAERTYRRKTIEYVDEDWGIVYPSENWCSAPNIFDVIRYFDEQMNVVIIPIYNKNRTFGYKIFYNDNEITNVSIVNECHSLLSLYNKAITDFVLNTNKC